MFYLYLLISQEMEVEPEERLFWCRPVDELRKLHLEEVTKW